MEVLLTSMRSIRGSPAALIAVTLCVSTSPANGGSFHLGRKQPGGPDMDEEGFQLLDDFNQGVGVHERDGWVVAVGDFNRCTGMASSG